MIRVEEWDLLHLATITSAAVSGLLALDAAYNISAFDPPVSLEWFVAGFFASTFVGCFVESVQRFRATLEPVDEWK